MSNSGKRGGNKEISGLQLYLHGLGISVRDNAQAFGYTIWVRDGFTLDRPSLAHELVHVAQIERSEGFDAFVKRYMMELLEHGHADMPLEAEAYEANQAYR